MATIHFPPQLRELVEGAESVDVDGESLGKLLRALDERFPGAEARLRDGDRLATGLAASIDGAVTNRGMLAKVGPASEVHILPAIGGG